MDEEGSQKSTEVRATKFLKATIEAYIIEAQRRKSTILLGLMEERFRKHFTEDEALDLGLEMG